MSWSSVWLAFWIFHSKRFRIQETVPGSMPAHHSSLSIDPWRLDPRNPKAIRPHSSKSIPSKNKWARLETVTVLSSLLGIYLSLFNNLIGIYLSPFSTISQEYVKWNIFVHSNFDHQYLALRAAQWCNDKRLYQVQILSQACCSFSTCGICWQGLMSP